MTMIRDARPLVSVVIPCHGQAHFLPVALESALGQDYGQAEVIVVDDGSPDDTKGVVSRYPGVRYLRQANRGLSAARNQGWRMAKGQFVVFLDADDWLHRIALSAGVACLVAHPEWQFVWGAYEYVNADGSFRSKMPQRVVESEHYKALLGDNVIGMCATVMFRRQIVEEIGGFDETLPACEDYDLFLRITRSHAVGCHGALVASYRQHDGNMSGKAALMLETALKVLKRQWRHVRRDTELKAAYERGLQYWREHYGEMLMVTIRDEGPSNRGAALLSLTRYAPGLLGRYVLGKMRRWGWRFARSIVPVGKTRLPAKSQPRRPRVGRIRFGDLRRLEPVSRHFGYDRGAPVDRYYIERFLGANADCIAGRVLEIGDDAYTRLFGGDRVVRRDVLHVAAAHPGVTIVGDLTSASQVPSDAFDCVILTQTLHLIYEIQAAIKTVFRILKPGGWLLATVPGISQTSVDEWAATWHWSMTQLSLRKQLGECFPEGLVKVEAHGNVLVAISFLQGLSVTELRQEELDFRDEQYEMLITARAQKPARS